MEQPHAEPLPTGTLVSIHGVDGHIIAAWLRSEEWVYAVERGGHIQVVTAEEFWVYRTAPTPERSPHHPTGVEALKQVLADAQASGDSLTRAHQPIESAAPHSAAWGSVIVQAHREQQEFAVVGHKGDVAGSVGPFMISAEEGGESSHLNQRVVLQSLQVFIANAFGANEQQLLGWAPEHGTVSPPSDPSFFKVTVNLLDLMAIPGSGFEWVPLYVSSAWATFLKQGQQRLLAEPDPAKRLAIRQRMEQVRQRMPAYDPDTAPTAEIIDHLNAGRGDR